MSYTPEKIIAPSPDDSGAVGSAEGGSDMVTATIETQSLMDEPEVIDTVVPHRWTREEYERMVAAGVFEGMHIELVDGVIWQMTPQDNPHIGTLEKITRLLMRLYPESYSVRPQSSLPLASDSIPEPDLAVVPPDPEHNFYVSRYPESALLVVEIADSSLRHDRKRKASLYARAGIPEYWIVNLVAWQLEVHREPGPDGYRSRQVLQLGETITPLSLPETEIPVADILPRKPL
jgi:Uma2 family endonuclease